MKPLHRKALICTMNLLAAGLLASCMVQTDNSVNGDASTFAPLPPGTSKEFAQASTILKTNCASCHSNDFTGDSEEQLVSQNWIVPGNPDKSQIFGHLKGSGAKGGFTQDMPKDLPPLSHQDVRTIHDWIEQVTNSPGPTPSPTFANTPFARAQAVILTNCATCHHHQAWKQFKEYDFIAKNLVDPGSADGSLLYQKLSGVSIAGVDPGDMPEGGDPLATADVQTIETWIDQISTPQPTASPSPSPIPTPSPSASVTLFNATQRTAAALAVIASSCSDCHTKANTASSTAFKGVAVGAFANFTADSDFVTAGLVSPGNPSTSWLIRSLQGYGDIASMPQGGDALSSADEATLTSWIAGIGQP
jgi:mono/diheme cytochrome c family protein